MGLFNKNKNTQKRLDAAMLAINSILKPLRSQICSLSSACPLFPDLHQPDLRRSAQTHRTNDRARLPEH